MLRMASVSASRTPAPNVVRSAEMVSSLWKNVTTWDVHHASAMLEVLNHSSVTRTPVNVNAVIMLPEGAVTGRLNALGLLNGCSLLVS